MIDTFSRHIDGALAEIEAAGLFKRERQIASPQGAAVSVVVTGGTPHCMINLCSNNYLGLANSKELIAAAKDALCRHGYGMASVRFICGTQPGHVALERRIAEFVGMEDSLLYSSCFDANTGLFEALFDERDAIISDALNHASIIDGIRLCRARRLRYANNDMQQLAHALEEAAEARFKVVVTDGVFSMDGVIADLPRICDLAEAHGAIVVVDDSHALGFVGETGRGTAELKNVLGRVDIVTGTFGKALGGALGGFCASRRNVVAMLRQRSRPYLFSNALPPAIVDASLAALDLIERASVKRQRLHSHSRYWRRRMCESGFRLAGADHPIIPILIGEAELAGEMAARLYSRGVLVAPFSFPVVPKGQARIRVQLSAEHEEPDLVRAANAFAEVGRELGIICR